MKIRQIICLIVFPAILIVVMYVYLVNHAKNTGKIDFLDHIDDVVATVDGEDLTLGDLSFYILYEEAKVEKLAMIYNPDSTKDYWNTHTNGYFVDMQTKEQVIKTAIHDRIMYNLAKEEFVTLKTDEKELLEKARTDFWEGLLEGQLERLPLSYEEGNRIMREIAVAQVYQQRLAKEMNTTYASLNWGGYDYENVLMKLHQVKINDKVWDRVVIGDISLYHEGVNYINGLSNEEKERLQNEK